MKAVNLALATLSTEQRLLLRLGRPGGGDQPDPASTQAALAAALGVSRSQVSRTVGDLVRRGLAAEEAAKLAGFGRTLTSYALTPAGREEADRLRATLRLLRVPVRRGGKQDTATLGDALQAGPAALDLGEALDRLAAAGHLDLDAAPLPEPVEAPRRFQGELLDAPPARGFVGRLGERGEVERWLASRTPILATEAAAGQGKSSFAAHMARSLAIPRHVLWVQVSASMRMDDLLARLDGFLGRLGRPRPALEGTGEAALLRGLRDRIGRLPLLVILDDLQKSGPSLQPAIHALVRLAAAAGNPRLWLLGRDVALPHDVLPDVRRLALGDLTDREADEVLCNLGVAAEHRPTLVRRCSGNPLFLVLAAASPLAPQQGADLARYLLGELVPSLGPQDRRSLELLGGLRVPADACIMDRLDMDPAAVQRLHRAHLVVRDDGGRVAVHDLVREILHDALPRSRRQDIHSLLAEAYRPRGDDWRGVAEFLHHVLQAGRRDEGVRWLLRNRSRFLDQAGGLADRVDPATPAL